MAVDLEAQAAVVDVVVDAADAIVDHEARGVRALFAHHGADGDAVEMHAVAPGADRVDLEPVALAAEREIDLLALGGGQANADPLAAEHARAERRPRSLVGEDRGTDERVARELGKGFDETRPLGAEAIEPARVDTAGLEIGGREDVEQIALVGGPALDDELEVAQRAGEPRDRFLPVFADRDDLGDQRIEIRRDDGPGRDAGVDARMGTERGLEERDAARRRQEALVRILGADPRLEGDAPALALDAFDRLAAGDPDLDLDEVDAGDQLGEPVLDLQARVHLEEVEVLALQQELDRADAAVADVADEVRRGVLEALEQGVGEARRRRFLDDLLVAALDRAVAAAEGAGVAVFVGGDLHFDVSAALDHGFDEEGAVAEGRLRLGGGGAERLGQAFGLLDDPDAAAAAARRRLEDDGEADLLRVRERFLLVGERPAAPGRDRNAGLLGEELRLDLVAEGAHRVGARPEEEDALGVQAIDEDRVFRHEAPARPDRVGASLPSARRSRRRGRDTRRRRRGARASGWRGRPGARRACCGRAS